MPYHKPAYNLTEKEIRYAMSMTDSNRDAARYLHIGYDIYKKYASMYFDQDTGKTLFEMHKNQKGWHCKKPSPALATMEDIFAGKYPMYSVPKLKDRLIREGHLDERCSICGFDERRISDYSVPLLLTWKNGNKRDHSKDNLELVCYNHYHVYYGDMKPRPYIIIKDVN